MPTPTLLLLLCAPTAPQAPGTDIRLPVRQTIDSPDSVTGFGEVAATLGDLDGDGALDYAISELSTLPFTPPDDVHLFSGRTGALLTTYSGATSDEQFGHALANVGDLDGDGLPDLLVGGPGFDGPANASGRARIFSGADGSVLWTGAGQGLAHGFGEAVLGTGDLTGDGLPDWLVTAGGESQSPAFGGVVRLFDGASGAAVLVLDNGQTTGDPSEGYGEALALGDDWDDDGRRDLLIGVPGRLESGFGRVGAVEARSSADGSLLFELRAPSSVAVNQRFGASIESGIDLNGDGALEILVGATGDSEGGSNVGAVFVFDGATQQVLVKHLGVEFGPGSLGHVVRFVGDVNGDGATDYAATYDYTGSVSFSGYVGVWSGADHAELDRLEGEAGYGSCLAALDDVDGDRLPEFVVGVRLSRRVELSTVAGARPFGALPAEVAQTLDLRWEPASGTDPARGRLVVDGAEPGATGLFAVSGAIAELPLLGSTFLVDFGDPGFIAVEIAFGPTGRFESKETTLRQPALDGQNLFCQVLAFDPAGPNGFVTSAGLDLRLTD